MIKRILIVYIIIVSVVGLIIFNLGLKALRNLERTKEQYDPNLEVEMLLQQINDETENRMNDLYK